MTNIADLREEYDHDVLRRDDTAENPIDQFRSWFEDALESDIAEPNAMTLATATANGRPSARIVLLKGIEDDGFIFYTNYNSRKGSELTQNPWAALVFWWEPLQRQVRIEGEVERVPPETSDEYFESRPRGSQIGAWASPQSHVIENRDVLLGNLEEVRAEYDDEDSIPRPSHWGGYHLTPEVIEFWQGRPSRLHDRIRYRRDDGTWARERLAP